MIETASASGIEPMCHPPRPTIETFSPVLPNGRWGNPLGLSFSAATSGELAAPAAKAAAAALRNSRRLASVMVMASL